MPLTGTFTPGFTATPYASSYWELYEYGHNKDAETYAIRMRVYENQSACANSYQPISKSLTYVASNHQQELSDTYTWDGTTNVVCSASDPSDLVVGDWIKNCASGKYFEVSVISGVNITILNPDTLTLPDTSASSDPAHKSSDPKCFKYFGDHKLSPVGKSPESQCEDYLLAEESDFSGYSQI